MEIVKVKGVDLRVGDNIILDSDEGVLEHDLLGIDREDDVVTMFKAEYLSDIGFTQCIVGVMKEDLYYTVIRDESTMVQ